MIASTSRSVFADFQQEAYPYRYRGTILAKTIAGGIPTNPNVAEAVKIVGDDRSLNGFKRNETGLYIEGRQLKSALKEAVSVAVRAGKLAQRGWGKTNKGALGLIAEHVLVVDDLLQLYTGDYDYISKPNGNPPIVQRFVSTFRGTGIQYEEVCEQVSFDFTVISDHDFASKDWAMIWLTGEEQGIGASRSQGYGRYTVVNWEASS